MKEKLTRRELFKLALGGAIPKTEEDRLDRLEENQEVIVDVLNTNSYIFNTRIDRLERVVFPVEMPQHNPERKG